MRTREYVPFDSLEEANAFMSGFDWALSLAAVDEEAPFAGEPFLAGKDDRDLWYVKVINPFGEEDDNQDLMAGDPERDDGCPGSEDEE
jgi:hypothetical protein